MVPLIYKLGIFLPGPFVVVITVYLRGCLNLVFGKDEKIKLMKLYLIKSQQTFKFRLSPVGE